jgi:hypothetical protein
MTSTELKNHPTIIRLRQIQTDLSLNDADFRRQLHFKLHHANWGKILAGTYQGDFRKALVNFEVCLDEYENQGLGELDDGIVVLKHVKEALDATEIAIAAEDEHRLVIVAGVRGAGKSRTLQLVHSKHGGYLTSARPSWSKSYLNFLNRLAETPGMVLGESRSAGEAESRLLTFMKNNPSQTLCIGEFNYFSSDALGFIKTAINETDWAFVTETIPYHLNRMASDRSTAQESAQLLRRVVAIIKIPPVSELTVESIRKAMFPGLKLEGFLSQIATAANQLDRIDSVCQILLDADPDDPADIAKSIERHKRFHNANLKSGDE